MSVIDVDHPESWPDSLISSVSIAAENQESAEYLDEIELRDEEDEPFYELLRGHLIRSFHATRLLDHEIENIRSGGLAPLSENLISKRIEDAVALGHLEREVGESLLLGNALKSRRTDKRADQVCLFLSDSAMREEVSGIWPLLAIWGGEGINFTKAGNENKENLQIGRPTIVVAQLDLSGQTVRYNCWPELRRLFVGRWLGFGVGKEGRFGADLFYYGHIPGDQIEEVLVPGSVAYDRYPELPRD